MGSPQAAVSDEGSPQSQNLGPQIKRAFGWSFLNNVLGRVGLFVSGVVLAHLLTPHDYGVFAVALVVLQVLMSLNDMGLSAAIIRWEGDLRVVARTATTLIVAASVALFAVMFVAAPAAARALNVPDGVGVLRLLAVGLIIDGCFSVSATFLTREFRQGARLSADMVNLVVSTSVTIALAANGYGAWSLAWGRIAGNTVSGLIILALSPLRVWPGFDRAHARKLLSFGIPLVGSNLLGIAMLNVDYVVVGRVLGPVALGLYLMAFNLSSWPVNVFSFAVRRVSLAGFSRLQNDHARMESAFARSGALLMAATIPVCALLATLGLPLIRFVYGDKWQAAAGALHFLAILGIARVALELAYDLLVALGKSRAVLALQGAWVAALIPALTVGAHIDGIRGVGVAHVFVALGLIAPAFAVALRRNGFGPASYLPSLTRPVLGGLVITGVGVAAQLALRGDIVELLVGGSAAGIAYLAIVYPMRHLLRSVLSKPADAALPSQQPVAQ